MALTSFSPDVWRDAARNWRGIGLLYMLVLLIITWSVVMVRGYNSYAHFVKAEAPQLVDQIPAVTITNGVVSIDKPEPCIITDPQTHKPLVIFDTTGATTEPPRSSPSVLVTRSKMLSRRHGLVQEHDLSRVKSFYLDKHRVNGWLMSFKSWFIPLLLPLMVIFSLIGRLILMLITAGIGMGLAAMMGASISYAAMLRLSALAMTPTMLLSTFLTAAGLPDFWNFIGIAVVLIYLAMMVKANTALFPDSGSGGAGAQWAAGGGVQPQSYVITP
jgi:hypothetical protein